MTIGIFTYGTRGDIQPYIGLALGLMNKGHEVSIAATEDFKDLVEGFGIAFQPLWGNAEMLMNSPEGQRILKSESPIKLMKYYFKVLHDNRVALRKSYSAAVTKVDVIIANTMTLPIVSGLAERHQKPMALTYFMPPLVPTKEFPLADFDFFNFPWYNKLTYTFALNLFWRIIKKDTNEFRKELGLPVLKESLVTHLNRQKVLDLYCFSPTLIPRPNDWESHHKITGFIHIPEKSRENHFLDTIPAELETWLKTGEKPIYMGFGSNGIGKQEKFVSLLSEILAHTTERILFCTGWSQFSNLPKHPRLWVCKYVNHEHVLPFCKVGIFHGGAGTLATMLRHRLPVLIISFYTDQPTWGKIVERKKIGVHIPAKALTLKKMLIALKKVQTEEIKAHAATIGQQIRNEKGLENTICELETYFLKELVV